MYKIFILMLLLGLSFACTKPTEKNDIVSPVGTDKELASGTFSGANRHTTTGIARLIKDKDGKRFLLLENFHTDRGPDLRIFLSTSQRNDNFIELTNKLSVGNVRLEVPAETNTEEQKFVLVWCKAFSVLFGSAELK